MASYIMEDESPLYLRAEVVHQRSNLLRLAAKFDHSERVVYDFCCGCGNYYDECVPRLYNHFEADPVNKRLNALDGRRHGSQLENLVQCDNYGSAIDEMDGWRTSNAPS